MATLKTYDNGSGKSFFFAFGDTDYAEGHEAGEAQISAAFSDLSYSAPECIFNSMENIEKCLSMDMWSLGCVLLEISTFITYGNPGLCEFQKQRKTEIASLRGIPENIGDQCFHNSHGPLESVQRFSQGIHRNGRRCDDITPRIVDLVLNRLLVP
ncbi:unnamed protein product [Clonostachys rosea]|uniref:Protein kinase domain-containing protein n=1 Tax=Bionectria ochroleuca TaxID=29856 RepID=A0ABY6ULB8_BIOOC|nr:unnamed protein product [Clonostachys rosea]